MRRPIKSKSYVYNANNKYHGQDNISSKKNKNNLKMSLVINNIKAENKEKPLSSLSSKKMTSYVISLNEDKYRNDKGEKKLYLENNNNMRNHMNIGIPKINKFKSFDFQSNKFKPKIETNLLNNESNKDFLLRKSMTLVKNMSHDFDNQKKKESFNDFDFNLNNKGNNNQLLDKNKDFVKEMKKGKIYLKNEESIKDKLKNEKKIIGLKNCFKYYELLYNYKYFITEKDILCLSFNRRKKMEKRNFLKYLKTPKNTPDYFDEKSEKCKKCEKNKKMDKLKYKRNLKIHLFNKNLPEYNSIKKQNKNKNIHLFKTELNNDEKNKEKSNKRLSRILSGYNSNIIEKNKLYNNSNFKYDKTFSRPTSSSTNKLNEFNKKYNFNSLSSNEKVELNLSNISSISDNNSLEFVKSHIEKSNDEPQYIESIKNKIKILCKNIKADSKKLKLDLEETYKNIMDKIEEEKNPVKKVKKKMIINIDKIRRDLNLKRRGKGIDEIKMIMDNVDKLYKSLPKTHVNLMRSIAKIVINEERMKNKPLIYNDTYDNKLFKAKLKKEMFKASYNMKEIRKSLNKYKIEKPFEEQLRHILKNDVSSFFSIKSLKEEINKIKAIKGEIITD